MRCSARLHNRNPAEEHVAHHRAVASGHERMRTQARRHQPFDEIRLVRLTESVRHDRADRARVVVSRLANYDRMRHDGECSP